MLPSDQHILPQSQRAQSPTQIEPSQHPLMLPPTMSPESVNILTDLYRTLERVRAGLDPHQSTQPRLLSKDMPLATDALRQKIVRAREQVRLLPDVQRGLAQQDAELRMLDAKIVKQREMLEKLGGMKYEGHVER